MATLADLIQAVNSLLQLSGVAATLQLNNNTRERAFEAYIFGLVLQAVQSAGGTVQLCGVTSGPNPPVLVFRGAPGQMSSRLQDFCYARCTLNGKTFEVHVDVKYEGGSRATHEVDVSLFDGGKADNVRNTGVLPAASGLLGAVECKFYDSSLGTILGRAFVGLVSDFSGTKIRCFVTNGTGQGIAQYFSTKSRPEPFFGVSPLVPGPRERFVHSVEQGLRKWAGVT